MCDGAETRTHYVVVRLIHWLSCSEVLSFPAKAAMEGLILIKNKE